MRNRGYTGGYRRMKRTMGVKRNGKKTDEEESK